MRLSSARARGALAAIARTFGERIRIEPRVPGEFSEAAPDPNRPPADAIAVVTLTSTTAGFDGSRQGRSTETMTRYTKRRAQAWLTPDSYGGLSFAPRPGDYVTLLSRPDEPRFEIARDPQVSDRGDCSLHLVMDGNQ